jgi:hypothetical protein
LSLQPGLKTITNLEIPKYSFSFKTAPGGIVQRYNGFLDRDIYSKENLAVNSTEEIIRAASLPAPPITIDLLNNPTPGYIFMATWDRNIPHVYGNFIFILDNSGQIIDSVRVNGAPFDFQVQPNGLLSYALGDFSGNAPLPTDELRHIVLDSTLAVVDSFAMKNGYQTDFHEFLLLPNGHAMMMSYHTIIYDMSTIVEGGKTDASLVINIIQEQDLDKNVVFEWRNIDYIPITDTDLDFTSSRINYGTLNAYEIDDDGNILASFRNHSEIMKINRETGELMWRWGGPRGEFTFIGEHEGNAPYYFSRQHDIRRMPNGNVTLFDNGESHDPRYSRAVEYQLDETNKIATLISEFLYPTGNIIAAAAGNAQLFPDGGWFVGYGILNPQSPVKRNAVEYHADGSVAFELSLPTNVIAYRAYKFPWKELVQTPSVTNFDLLEGNTYSFNNSTDSTGVMITYNVLVGDVYPLATITRLPYGPVQPQFIEDISIVYPVSIRYEGASITSHISEFHIDLAMYPEIKQPSKTVIYGREFPGQGLFILLPTTYDDLSNELIITTTRFGEFVFVETDFEYTANIPIQYEPADKLKVLPLDSLAIRWTGKGFYDSFQLQFSTDNTFGTILNDSTINSSFLFIKDLVNHTKYFWRVRSVLGLEESDWSPVWSFETTAAFVTIVSPNGGEGWNQEETKIIRWETNILDSVKIDLIIEQQNVLPIGESPGSVRAFQCLIPTDLAVDSSYRIQIMSLVDSSIIDTSDDVFSISVPTGIEIINEQIPVKYALLQNYPNPFNPSTIIEFDLPVAANVRIEVYSTLGQMVEILLDKPMSSGRHEVKFYAKHLPSGIYFYRIQSAEFQFVKKMVLLK